MKERPVHSFLFSTPMVRALLGRHKTQTRRVMRPQPTSFLPDFKDRSKFSIPIAFKAPDGLDVEFQGDWIKPPVEIGEQVWVREAWRKTGVIASPIAYKADEEDNIILAGEDGSLAKVSYRYKPSIFMPRAISRITLEITDVGAERLQDITELDALAEGVTKPKCIGLSVCGGGCDACEAGAPHVAHYAMLWDSLNGKKTGYSWAANPWVWVFKFKVVKPV